MKYLQLFFLFALSLHSAELLPHLRKIEKRIHATSIEGVDCTYLINLDERRDRLNECLQNLLPFGILPQRFPAIYGWRIPLEEYADLGVKFGPGMWPGKENALLAVPNRGFFFVQLSEAFYGQTFFSGWLTPGALGCTLSHLSVLQDALDAGYETIWVLEDDFVLIENPHLLSGKIEELDRLVGASGWDVLYTDSDYLFGVDPTQDLQAQLPMKWRPDRPDFDLKTLLGSTPVGDGFLKIGSRIGTHSMMIRRSGVEKILRFNKEHGIFMPYDHEIAFVPDIRLYALKQPIVGAHAKPSDTKNQYF
ncbi:MAG: glycosyltransferase family 25 protein [Chlamydiales bacterium]